MNPNRFDTLAKQFVERRLSRRTALSGTVVTLAAAVLGIPGPASAQQATPPPDATPRPAPLPGNASTKTMYLFAQPFDSGTWEPHPSEPGTYLLTLKGDVGQTIYFSDRPQRIFGTLPTQQFLDGLGFSPANPPNAAIIAQAHGDEDQLVIELHDPVLDAEKQTLTYHVKVLADYSGAGLAHAALQQNDANFADSFGHGSLFIDDCASGPVSCITYDPTARQNVAVGTVDAPQCYTPSGGCSVESCSDWDPFNVSPQCAEAYPNACYYKNESGGILANCWGGTVS